MPASRRHMFNLRCAEPSGKSRSWNRMPQPSGMDPRCCHVGSISSPSATTASDARYRRSTPDGGEREPPRKSLPAVSPSTDIIGIIANRPRLIGDA